MTRIDEQLFQFDSFDDQTDLDLLYNVSQLSDSSTSAIDPVPSTSSPSQDPPVADGSRDDQGTDNDGADKGKSVSQPVPIRNSAAVDVEHDLFDFSPPSSSGISTDANPHISLASTHTSPSYFYPRPTQSPLNDIFYDILSIPIQLEGSSLFDIPSDGIQPYIGKGKGKELPPSLPPLTFSPTEFGYGNVAWPSPGLIAPVSGPSSYGSGYGSLNKADQTPEQPPNLANAALSFNDTFHRHRRIPSRHRSLSSLSINFTHSITTPPVPHSKVSSSKVPESLARKLLFRKRRDLGDLDGRSESTMDICSPPTELSTIGQGNCLIPWRGDLKLRRTISPTGSPFSNLKLDLGLHPDQPTLRRNHGPLRVKARSYSSPLPLSSVENITAVCADIFMPPPMVVRNYFDEIPRELQLNILSSLRVLHEAEYERYKMKGKWTAQKAGSSKGRWVGRNRADRELVRLSRVSKAWQGLVFDGQLWTSLDLNPFPTMPASLILRLVSTAGPFIRSLSFMGHGQLLANTLTDVTTHLCMEPAPLGGLSRTQLTSLNLQGCAGLTTRSLHHLLIRSPSLQKLSLKGLSAATNTTCDVIAAYCPYLVSLNLSGCSGLDASGLLSLASAAISRGGHLLLTELRISGLKAINDTIMATLGKAAPYLEILDLSYVRHLHNSALQAFVSCEASFGGEMVELTSRQAGHDPGNPTKYRRRLTRLRHLSLSSCVLLTDIACSHLAYSMPRLEYLELAGIGAELRDDGLVRLLGTTPYLRRLDLEDASEITDDVLTALTPDSEADAGLSAPKHSEPQTGHMLEHLIISFAANVTDNALFDLIRGCTHLRVLEADNTPISSAALKEFVRLSRQRRIMDSRIVAIDCRGISESVVNELSTTTRPRLGWRSYHARKLRYLDGRDKEDLKVGQDECDETRVVLKTFHSWQMVDAVKAAREKRRKSTSRRAANDSNGSVTDSEDFLLTNTARARWWSPSGRRISGGNSPTTLDTNSNEGCRIM